MPHWLAITSSDNPQIKQVKQLMQNAKDRSEQQKAVLEGLHLCHAAKNAGWSVSASLVAASAQLDPEILALFAVNDRVLLVEDRLFRQLSHLDQSASVIQVIATVTPAWPQRWAADALFLDGVQDPGNLGTLIRTCAAAGIEHLFLSADCADAWSPKVLRAAMGGHFAIQIYLKATLERLLALGPAAILATTLRARQSLFDSNLLEPTLWCFGNEGQGLRPATLAALEQHPVYAEISIPQSPKVESLNVAAAAAICLFEQRRQRSLKTGC
jgi:RNA methyltransferase, TrmH family